MSTIKLYEDNAYLKEFEATVVSVEAQDGLYLTVLDQTAFFPEEGGQNADRGFIGEDPVLDVQIKNDVIYHYLEKEYNAGDKVKGYLDFEYRFDNMQQHSGEHLFSGLAHTVYGCTNVGFHLGDREVTVDLDKDLSMEQILDIEMRANAAIQACLDTHIFYPTDEELKNIEYRLKKEIDGQIRLVEYPGVDICACCAPHVKNTGEIGILKVVAAGKYKGGVRITLLCGMRALRDYEYKRGLLASAGLLISANQENFMEHFTRRLEERDAANFEVIRLKKEMMALEVELSKPEDPDRAHIIFTKDKDMNIIREGVNSMMEKSDGYCGVFLENGDEYQYIIGSKKGEAKRIMLILKEYLDAKGGGNDQMIQGKVSASREDIEKMFMNI